MMNHSRPFSLFLAMAILCASVTPVRAAGGSLDPTFGNGGIVITDFAGLSDYTDDMAIQAIGKMLVAGVSGNFFNNDFALSRYNRDGNIVLSGTVTETYYEDLDFAVMRFEGGTGVVEAQLDVRPGKFPNRIDLKDACTDNLPVALLTTSEFNVARDVDGTSLALGDPNLVGVSVPVHSQARDIDRDGDKDVWLLFPLCDLVTNGAVAQDSAELVLTGLALDGVPLTARDSVEIIQHGPRRTRSPMFVYPVDGQALDYRLWGH